MDWNVFFINNRETILQNFIQAVSQEYDCVDCWVLAVSSTLQISLVLTLVLLFVILVIVLWGIYWIIPLKRKHLGLKTVLTNLPKVLKQREEQA
jgi:hypothetical protein